MTACAPSSSTVSQTWPPRSVNLHGVVQQVADDLRQPRRVGVEIDRLRRQRDRQLVVHALVQRADGLDGLLDDGRELDALFAQLDLASRDAAHVEQVVDQPRHLADLALQHLGRRLHSVARRCPPGAAPARRC